MIERLRAWARGYTDAGRYSPVGVAFHWVMAALVVFQLGWGVYAAWQLAGGDKVHATQLHGAVGLALLALAALRLLWRAIVPGPVNAADRQGWQTLASKATHVAFYVCFFGLPLSGWAMWSAEVPPAPLALAGVVPWPALPLDGVDLATRWRVLDAAADVHAALVKLLIALTALHAGAALKHHFWDRDEVLEAMVPEVPDAPAPTRPAPPRTPPARRPRRARAAG